MGRSEGEEKWGSLKAMTTAVAVWTLPPEPAAPVSRDAGTADGAVVALHDTIDAIWQVEPLSTDWYNGEMLYKKGTKSDPSNFRAICLLSHAYKAMSITILGRVKIIMDRRVADSQNGFREGRGCRDNLFVPRPAMDDVMAAGKVPCA